MPHKKLVRASRKPRKQKPRSQSPRLLSAARPLSAARILTAARLFTAEDALQPPPPLAWSVEGLFARPSVNMLVGASGSRKTYLAIDLAVCIALGKSWLGFPTTQSPVLFIDEQTGPRQLWARFNASLNAHQAPPAAPVHYMSMAGHGFRDQQLTQALIDHSRKLNAGLIIFDSFADLLRGGGENSLGAVGPVLRSLRLIAEQVPAAVLVTHNTNQHGLARGSSSIIAALDLLLSIEFDSESGVLKMKTKKSRSKEPAPFDIRPNFETAPDGTLRNSFERYVPRPSGRYRFPFHYGLEYEILNEVDIRTQASFHDLYVHNISFGTRRMKKAIQTLRDLNLITQVTESKQGIDAIYELSLELRQKMSQGVARENGQP